MPVFHDDDHYLGTPFLADLEDTIHLPVDDILLLTKSDVPSSFLSSKYPAELNVMQLK